MPLWDGRETPEEYAERQRRNAERAEEREQNQIAWKERQRERERKHQEYLQRQREREERQREQERKNQEWQQKQRERERDKERNRSKKLVLIVQASVISELTDWKEGVRRAKELQFEWKNIKYRGEDENGELWDSFRAYIQTFFDRMNEHFRSLEAKQDAARLDRERIIDKARSLAVLSVDWASTAKQLDDLRRQFASCGPFRRKEYDDLWGRFNKVVDEFHKDWKEHKEAVRLQSRLEHEQRAQRSANWPGARFTRDVTVNPVPAASLSTARPVGRSSSQNAVKDKWVSYMERKGYENIRVNQRQVTGEGTQVGINRPDLSGNGPHTGDRLNAEFETSKSNRGPEHERRIIANDSQARVVIKKAD